jgi:ADP-ribosylglycohydrolase
MIAAIAGDIIGSVHERANLKRLNFELFEKNSRFTDDTVMSLAVADAILEQKPYGPNLHEFGRKYMDRGYGGRFRKWLESGKPEPYGSDGNGSAMRVSAFGWAFNDMSTVSQEAQATAQPSHNHPEGIKGAQAIAASVFMARKGKSKKEIKAYVESNFGYDLHRHIKDIRPNYKFDVTCQGSVPEAIIAFLDSDNVEHAIRLGVSLGGDADTLGCMAGSIAQAYYKEIPKEIVEKVQTILTPELLDVLQRFEKQFKVNYKVI